jgi:2,3-bisphosphoglycerate-independent phosphoglycerate mutase
MAIVDTLGIADELARDGVFSREQAERLARVSGRAATEALVTKADLETAATAIRTEIALLRKDLEQTIADLRTAAEANTALLRSEIESNVALLRSELESNVALLRSGLEASTALLRNEFEARLQATARELVKWFAGILLAHGIAVIGVTVTLVKLL